MRVNKFIGVAGAVLLLGTAAGMVNAPSAQAVEPTPTRAESSIGTLDLLQMETDDDRPGGRVLFNPTGDVVQLWEQQEGDGKDVEIVVWNATHDPNTYEYGFYNRYEDEDIVVEARGEDGQPWNMTEGHCYRFRIRLVDHNTDNVVKGSTDYAQWRNNDGESDQCSGVN